VPAAHGGDPSRRAPHGQGAGDRHIAGKKGKTGITREPTPYHSGSVQHEGEYLLVSRPLLLPKKADRAF